MSSVASSSVPPRHGKKLAEVSIAEAMDGAMKENHKRVEELEDDKSDGELTPPPPSQEALPPKEPPQPEIHPVQGYTMTTAVYPPQPCERCVRSKKTCKGIAGARCEHCKSLHQKCSNSTGPPRGRHAAANNQSTSRASGENGKATPIPAARPKRKAISDKGKHTDDVEDENDDGDDEEEDEKGQPARKKRRPNNDRRARLLKEFAEAEAAIKRLQAAFTKDLTKVQQTLTNLASHIRDLD